MIKMKLFVTLIAALIIGCIPNPSKKDTIAVDKLTCEYKIDPLGISSQTPRLGWQLSSTERGQSQSAYQVLVTDDPELLKSDRGNIWDSGKIISGNSILIDYSGSPLAAGKKYFWKVKVWDKDGNESSWSKTASWQMGLLSSEDWARAKWIGFEDMPDSLRLVPGLHQSDDGRGLNKNGKKALQRPVVPLFRKEFRVIKKIQSASLYITGLGQYEVSLNGKKIGDAFLTPGWTYYDKTILYNTYDVTGYLRNGDNALGVMVGNGFYNINRERYRKLIIAFGMPKMIARLNVKYSDGSEDNVVSGADWKTSPSPITFTSIYGGEDYNAQLEQKGWDSPGFSASAWKDVLVVKQPEGKLVAEADYQLAVKEKIAVKKVQVPREGVYLYDFGQNASGIVELKVKGKKGQEVRLIPAELITKDNLANQKASGYPYYFSYTLKGDGIETWRPRFTYYGFRYVQVEGAVPDTIKSKSDLPRIVVLEMLHTRNSTPEVGKFECSNQLFNRINSLIDWAIKSNLQSVVTDCPHREKLGWLEQTLLMGGGIHYNFDLFHLYSKQVEDMIEAQTPEGLVPDIAPEYVVFEKGFRDSPEWGSASVVLPWMVYKWYGDISVMEKAWPMMIKYVEYLKSKSKDNIVSHGLGDWFDYGPKRPGPAQLTPMALTATAIYYYDLKLLTDMAGLLGKKEEQKSLSVWADEVKMAFNKEFFNEKTCVYSTGSQTAMSMPLCFGMVDNQLRGKVVENLVDSIKKHNKALTAGDVGFHYLVQALTEGGASQLLFEMNNRDDVPGYGFQLRKGATALTESWPALEEVSNNHLMLGHIMEWFYTGLGGISQEENFAAYKEISIHPDPVGDITEAKTSYQSPYGLIDCEWQKKNNVFTLSIDIPVNASAKVYFPVKEIQKIKENGKPIEGNKEFEPINSSKNESIIKVGSGKYSFEVKLD
jgi:alpha-L-rhamnosidase